MDEPDQPASLGAFLREARTEAGISIRELAARARMHNSYLVKLETGQYANPSAEILQRLADALGIDPNELLRFIGVKEASTLPPLRGYFRRKLGVNADEAEVLARLIENHRKEQHGSGNAEDKNTNKREEK